MNRVLEPSEINFLVESDDCPGMDEDTVKDLLAIFIEKNKVPMLQVAEKNGLWFALDSPLLHVIKVLEGQGKCSRVQVEMVALSMVPEKMQACMSTESDQIEQTKSNGELENEQSEKCEHSKGHRRGFRRLQIEENFGIESDLTKSLSNISLYEDYGGDLTTSSSEASDCDQYFNGDEAKFLCNACESSFHSERQLMGHQFRRNHFSCCNCDAFFMSIWNLQLHKKATGHWSEEELALNGDRKDSDQAPVERLL